MRVACIAFVAGAWWLQQQADLPSVGATSAASLIAFGIAILAARIASSCNDAAIASSSRTMRSFATRIASHATVGCAAFIVGYGWAGWRAEVRLAEELPHALEGRDVVVVGVVAALPGIDPRGVRFPFAVESVLSLDDADRPLVIPSRLSLGWYRPGRGGASGDGAVPDVRPGQRWRLTIRLKRPHSSANPLGFDYEYWLLEDGQRATGSVRPGSDDASDDGDDDPTPPIPSTSTRKLSEFVWRVPYAIERMRARLRDRVLTILADGGNIRDNAPYAGVIVALIVGDQRAIAQSDWIVFNRTGIGHLVSISGLHVSMLAALGAWLVFTLWRHRPGWCGRLAAHKAAALAGALVALAYCLLAGFGVPAQRTLYMIAVVAVALWMHRLSSVSRVLCIALAIVVTFDPWAVMGSGFWLSFCAVTSIFYVTTGRLAPAPIDASPMRRAMRALRAAARVQWAVTLALTPLTLLFFYQVSLISPLANAIAIPLVSFVVTPLALAGAVLPAFVGGALLYAAHGLVALLAAWLQWLSATRIAVWSGAAPSTASFVCAMIGVVWWLAPRGLPQRWTGALWMVPLFAWPSDRPGPGDVRMTALDIGQGTSILLETRTTTVLYDTGPAYAPDNDAGNRIIVPFLRGHGIGRLDTMIVSHNDNDHSGGALSVLHSVAVGRVFSSLEFTTPVVRASPQHRRCESDQSWTSDGVRFQMLAPGPDIYATREGKAQAKPNARSCVLRVEARGRVLLLTADIEKAQESALIERRQGAIASDVLLVPHHGSRTSSTASFLDAVHPRIAIVQAGYLNRFGHPRADVLARYAARGIPVLRNDRDGAITVVVDGGGIAVDRYRWSHRRYWYGR
ncbi:MAG: DNA internalization-related competence protein ComEC/Rec2 [Burkholderiaceae bacterium]